MGIAYGIPLEVGATSPRALDTRNDRVTYFKPLDRIVTVPEDWLETQVN